MTRPPGLLIVLSAPSGGGKTTLSERIVAEDSNVRRAITCTTRAPRRGERDGVDYHFLSLASFTAKHNEPDQFLEHAQVHGHHYGTLKSEVLGKLREGFDVLLSIDVQGAGTLKRRAKQDRDLRHSLITVFLAPPSLAVLEQRLRSRRTDSNETIVRRIAGAQAELERWRDYDYLIVSGTVENDMRKMLSILTAERLRSERVIEPPPSLAP